MDSNLLKRLQNRIYIRIIGADWKGKEFTGHDINGFYVYFNSRNHGYSSTELINRIKSNG